MPDRSHKERHEAFDLHGSRRRDPALRLPRKLPKARLDSLQSAFDLNRSANTEVRFAWLDLAVSSRYDAAVASLEQFLTSQGRGKFVRPLTKALAEDRQWGRPIAERIYPKARPLYHPLVTR